MVVKVALHFNQNGNSELQTMTLNPICSDVIVCNHEHEKLWIDDTSPIIATDKGIEKDS